MQAVIFVGIQAAGKSTFYQRRFFRTHVRVNLDMLHTRHRERLLIQTCLDANYAAQLFEPGYALLRGPLLGREVVGLVFGSAWVAVGFSFPVAGLCGMADRR